MKKKKLLLALGHASQPRGLEQLAEVTTSHNLCPTTREKGTFSGKAYVVPTSIQDPTLRLVGGRYGPLIMGGPDLEYSLGRGGSEAVLPPASARAARGAGQGRGRVHFRLAQSLLLSYLVMTSSPSTASKKKEENECCILASLNSKSRPKCTVR